MDGLCWIIHDFLMVFLYLRSMWVPTVEFVLNFDIFACDLYHVV